MKLVNESADEMQVFVIINNAGMQRFIGKGICDKRFIWNPSNWDCECDTSFDGEYQVTKIVTVEKKLIEKLVKECSENVDGNEMIYNWTLNDYEYVILLQDTENYLSLLFYNHCD